MMDYSTLVPGARFRIASSRGDDPWLWRVRARTADGRYILATANSFGKIVYTILDTEENLRGPMNVIGWGLGIFTNDGPDPAIDEAIEMLEAGAQWEISHRNRLDITSITVRKD